MNPGDNIEHAIEQLHLTTKAEVDERILGDAFVALRGAVQKQPGTVAGIWRTVVMNRIGAAAALAAVILVAFALFFGIPTRKAVTIKEIYGALGKTGNIHISTFQADRAEPHQQVWASQSLKVRLFKAGSGNQAQLTLWDISNKVKMIKYLSSVRTEALTEQMLAELEEPVTRFSALVPFSGVNDVPEDARWNRIDNPEVAAIAPGTEAYELIWMQRDTASGVVAYRKWRVFVDSETNSPKRAELYAKLKPEDEYRLETLTVVAYPSESEIQAVVEIAFARPGDPVYRGTPGADRWDPSGENSLSVIIENRRRLW
jgi:hypothetical protein